MREQTPTENPKPSGTTWTERVRFGDFEVDFRAGELRKNGLRVKLHSQPLSVLEILLHTPGQIVTREQLHQKLWGSDTFVDFEHGLNKAINKLRDALSDSADNPRYIETLPKRGYRFIGPIVVPENTPAPTPLPTTPPAKRLFSLKVAFVITAVFLAALGVWFGMHSRPASPAVPTRVMFAVLPFQNLTGNSNEDYFADGLTEEMIAQLGQLQPSALGVIARTSAMRYKNTNESVTQIGKELGVNYLLEGSVRQAGDRVRITAQLIQANDQTHLWAESYETPLTDILKVQREISERITHSLRLELIPASRNASTELRFDPEAYRKYLLGLTEFRKGTREGLESAIRNFQDAIAIDPANARPYAALAQVYSASVPYYRAPSEAGPLVKQAAQKAIQLDPALASAHVTLGDAYLFFDWNWAGADVEYRRALDLNPNSPDAQLGYSNYLSTQGRHNEAVSHARQAYLFDPMAVESRNEALWIHYFSGQLHETIEQANKTIELEPQAGLPYALRALAEADLGQRTEALHSAGQAEQFSEDSPSVLATAASAIARAGQHEKAKQLLNHALDLAQSRYVCRFLVAGAYNDLGETEQAISSLELAYRQHST
ncbi:MAG TPA: winged helix-turn-helix domain-containing protein [Terriglobales bacterium]|jgi:TolB-like protein/DNA-binding winged helix-turn-helix (wHTH) protein/Tfp pilus assembly protein PilF|nr:winged helix-turn-helix domain-containing protein [Terriglobales bacterium]